jgi:hypothetical protein
MLSSVIGVLIELPAIPQPVLDVAQDDDGYSAELSVERDLSPHEYEAFSDACLRLLPVVKVDGAHEVRGLVSVDEDTLWVYVHELGPGRYGREQEKAARDLLEHLWLAIHEASSM